MTEQEKWIEYLKALKKPFQKLCRLRFLNPDGSTAFSVDNNPLNRHNGAFIEDGTLTVNLQNGVRRTASVTLANISGAFDYNVNNLWFGTEVALDEGLVILSGSYIKESLERAGALYPRNNLFPSDYLYPNNGFAVKRQGDTTEFYIQQGVFVIQEPKEIVEPNRRLMQYELVDKWANLDGTLWGKLESTYRGAVDANIFQQINALLQDDRGNGRKVDEVSPCYTDYYNGKTQTLPDGKTANLTDAPYTLEISPGSGTYASVILGFAEMLNAWVGYDATGRLRIDPSQDDILDKEKPISYTFSMGEATLLGMTYTAENTAVYNDYIVLGAELDDNSQPGARATNNDPTSDTNANLIGRKTVFTTEDGYATEQQCRDRAEWELKRATVLQKSVNISCAQIFHIRENELVEITRTDKQGAPTERHLVTGFSRPLSTSGTMTISATSVADFPIATVETWPPKAAS